MGQLSTKDKGQWVKDKSSSCALAAEAVKWSACGHYAETNQRMAKSTLAGENSWPVAAAATTAGTLLIFSGTPCTGTLSVYRLRLATTRRQVIKTLQLRITTSHQQQQQ